MIWPRHKRLIETNRHCLPTQNTVSIKTYSNSSHIKLNQNLFWKLLDIFHTIFVYTQRHHAVMCLPFYDSKFYFTTFSSKYASQIYIFKCPNSSYLRFKGLSAIHFIEFFSTTTTSGYKFHGFLLSSTSENTTRVQLFPLQWYPCNWHAWQYLNRYFTCTARPLFPFPFSSTTHSFHRNRFQNHEKLPDHNFAQLIISRRFHHFFNAHPQEITTKTLVVVRCTSLSVSPCPKSQLWRIPKFSRLVLTLYRAHLPRSATNSTLLRNIFNSDSQNISCDALCTDIKLTLSFGCLQVTCVSCAV